MTGPHFLVFCSNLVSEVDNASPWQLAVVLNQPSFTNSLQAYVGNDISEQLEAISRFCRQLSRQRKLSRDKEATALQLALSKPVTLCGVELGDIIAPPGTQTMFSARGPLPQLRPRLPSLQFACNKTALISSELHKKVSGPAMSEAVKLWDEGHHVLMEDACDELPALSAGHLPTRCQKLGYGRCVCCGAGLVHHLAKRNLCKWIAAACPKDTLNRRLLQRASMILEFTAQTIDGTKITKFLQIGVMYLKPVRPTFVVMRDTGRIAWGRRVLEPVMKPSGKFTVITLTLHQQPGNNCCLISKCN